MFSLYMLRGIFERSVIFSLLTHAMFVTSRILRFDDLTLEGSFGIGSSIAALLLSYHYPPFFACLCAIFGGIIAGLVTGLLHTKLKLNSLMSGIITTTASFSVVLKISGAHVSLPAKIFSFQDSVLLTITVFSLFFLLYQFFNTEHGFLIKAVGDNPRVVLGLSKSPIAYQLYGLMLANGIVALSGALFTYYIGYFSVWSNIGMLVLTLASLILAEAFTTKMNILLFSGAFLYQLIIALTYSFHIDQDWNKLITATIIIICIMIQNIVKK
jgi:putative tryptophan/tyrosine transport system permease protein